MLGYAVLARKIHSDQTDDGNEIDDDGEPTNEIDQRQRQKGCKGCVNLKKSLELMATDESALIQTAKELGDEIRQWERKYLTLEKRSNDITARMAGVLEVSGNLENINDQYANTKLAKRFEDLYDKQWTDLSEWLQENVDKMTELDSIKMLTSLMKLSYEECLRTADSQLRKFLFLDENDVIPLPIEEPELFRLRRKTGQAIRTRKIVKQTISREILSTEPVEKIIETNEKDVVKRKLEEFFEEFVDICWLMSINHPRLMLNFDVVGKPYTGTTKGRFLQYSCQDIVIEKNLSSGDIFAVVWPSVELENEEGVCAKGSVITVQEGRDCLSDSFEQRRKSTGKAQVFKDIKEDTISAQNKKENVESLCNNKNVITVGNEVRECDERLHGERNVTAVRDWEEDEFEEISLTSIS